MVRFRALAAIGAASTFLSSAAVYAADLVYIPPSVISPVSIADWSGFYMGINGGLGQAALDYGGVAFGFDQLSGASAGLQLGYNVQLGSAVIGVEGDLQAAHMTQTTGAGAIHTLEYFGTLRARAGVSLGDRFMPYVTGGVAMAGGHQDMTDMGGPEARRLHSGWTVGVGVEAMLTDAISVKAEYLHLNLGPEMYFPLVNGGGLEASMSANIVRAGFNYRF